MKADSILDYAIFELSHKHSRCELFVSSNGETEKLASGLIQPFVNHLNVLATQSLFRAEVEKSQNGKSWFTRRTFERFVQFVNGPEVLERVGTIDLEMSQLEAARTLYSQDDEGVTDATKKELSRAIDLRLEAIKKDLTTAIAQASADGFDPQTVSDLQRFADTFGAHHLNEACGKYISLCQRRPDLIKKTNETSISQAPSSKNAEEEKKDESVDESSAPVKTTQHTRRLSVQDRINLFESKKTEDSNSAGHKPVVVAVAKSTTELRRLSSDVSSAPAPVLFPQKSVLRRWSVVSDMSFDFASDNKKSDGSGNEEGPSSRPSSGNPDATVPKEPEENRKKSDDDDVSSTRCDDSQNGDDLGQREEESYASKPHNVAQPSVMFPYRHSRSRSAHMGDGIDELQSQSRKNEVILSDKQPVLTILTKPASSAGSQQRQNSSGVEDDLEVNLVNKHSAAGKINNSNRVRATSVDHQMQRTRSSQGVNDELKMKANDLEKMFAEHNKQRGDVKDSKNVVMRRNVSDLSYSDDSKGKLYETYMKKRDAKLREEWSSKEAKLKSMQEALERSRTEMKAKLSEKRQDSISSTRQRAEKLRSFNTRSSMKKFQHPISSLQSEEEDVKDKAVSGNKSSASSRSSSQVRKAPSPNRSSRTSKPSGKVSNTNVTTSGRGRRTTTTEVVVNPVAQSSSIPNFSDLKKENTKPSSLPVRNPPVMMRTQVRSGSNKKAAKEDIPSPAKPRRPRSLRKSFSANIEFTELYSDEMMNKEMNEKQNTDVDDVPENLRNEEEFDEIESEAEEEVKQVVMNHHVKEEEEEEKTLVAEDIVNEKALVENSSEDENVTCLRSISQVDLPVNTTLLPSPFQHHHTIASLMDSPSESPLSWNSNLQHAFSYPHNEHSDADASMDYSPMGSPASWSSRMRKKWGTAAAAQSPPTIVSNSSPLHSRKDLAKGIKRLLKFGKKTRAADSLMDWVSVTTSEGDEDFAYRSSDELRKTRMASSQSQHSEDEQGSFKAKDGEFKKSFFSLSTFRNKGNDSKPR